MAVAGRPMGGKRFVFIVTALILAAIVAGFALTHRALEQAEAGAGGSRPPIPVTAVVAESGALPRALSGIGTLQAVHQITVAPEIGGRVVKLFFVPGQTVGAGEPLVQINDEPERGDLANYQALERVASANLERDKTLSARDFQSRQVVDQQQSLLDQAKAGIAKAEAQIAQKLIRAPFAGQLGVRQIDVGSYVNPGGPIVTLTDLSTLWVNVTLPEQATPDIHIGQPAHIRADSYPDRVFDAAVTAIEPQISAQTRTILVQATLDNPGHLLLPGMFADAEIVLPEAARAVLVPETAVDYSLYGDSAFVIREDGKDEHGRPILKVTRVPVQVGDRAQGKIAILSGLSAGDRVVASGQLRLSNGATVAIEHGDPLATLPSAKTY
jgi:multidrug efflux system membrane fusion protein